MARRRKYVGRVLVSREAVGRRSDGRVRYREKYRQVGVFDTKRERDRAVAEARVYINEEAELAQRPEGERITCCEYADRYLERVKREQKSSSYNTARSSLQRFKADFGDRPLASITRTEAEDWVQTVPPSRVPIVVTMFNRAVDAGIIDRNPFKRLGKRTKGRRDEAPPTPEQFERLLDGCAVLGRSYTPVMRSLMLFAAYTGMRPGELMALEWSDIDLTANRIHVRRRLYRGKLDLPKSNEERTIALPPPARDALLGLPTRGQRLVFTSKTGKRLSQGTLSGYWGKVTAAAGLDFDFYLATKHYGVHLLYKLGLSQRAIAAQMGWSERGVEKLLRVYGHIDQIGLSEIDKLYAENVVLLRPVKSEAS